MAVRRKDDTGFNRRVRAAWLTETLRLTAAGETYAAIEARMKEVIGVENKGKETIRKVFVHLNRVWLEPPTYCQALRDAALEIFRHNPDDDNAFLLNWGMCIAAYPFIGHVAEATGRLLRLQGEAQALQVNTRLRERFGDRSFIHRSVRYNLSTFLDFGALQEGAHNGAYQRGRILTPRTPRELAWLVESLLHTQDEPSLPLRQITGHGALFPFDLANLTQDTIKANPRLDIFRHGLNETLVTINSQLSLQLDTKADRSRPSHNCLGASNA